MSRDKINFVFRITTLLFISLALIFSLNIFRDDITVEMISYSTPEELEVIINNALIECYAVEGAYPSDLDYLKKYGLMLNEEKYIYNYTVSKSYELPTVSVELR